MKYRLLLLTWAFSRLVWLNTQRTYLRSPHALEVLTRTCIHCAAVQAFVVLATDKVRSSLFTLFRILKPRLAFRLLYTHSRCNSRAKAAGSWRCSGVQRSRPTRTCFCFQLPCLILTGMHRKRTKALKYHVTLLFKHILCLFTSMCSSMLFERSVFDSYRAGRWLCTTSCYAPCDEPASDITRL